MNYEILGKDKPYKGKEDNLQIALARWLKMTYPNLLWFHTPNGGSRNAFEAYKFKSMGVLPGVSDIIIFEKKQDYSGLIIELKVKGGRLQQTQRLFLNEAAEKGFKCVVCYSFESTQKEVKNYLALKDFTL